MKIGNTGPVGTTTPSRRARQTSKTGSTFAGQVQGEAPVRGVAPPSDVSAANALLTVQEVGDPLDEKRQAMQRGEDLLDRLDDLRLALLTGSLPRSRLDAIVTMVQDRSHKITDPALREILQEIELRAAVELAKLGEID